MYLSSLSSGSHKPRCGFTLIELLVVIAIIAILASILFPVFAQAREKARGITCLSNLKQLALGCMQYVQDFDENYGSAEWYNSGTNVYMSWREEIFPYVKSNMGVEYGYPTAEHGIWSCPSFPDPTQYAQYGIHWDVWPAPGENIGSPTSVSDAAIQLPAELIMIAEKGREDTGGQTGNWAHPFFIPWETSPITGGDHYWTEGVGNPPGSKDTHDDIDNGTNGTPNYFHDCDFNNNGVGTFNGCDTFPRYRHTNTSNFVFFDGHAKSMTRGRLNWYRNVYPGPINVWPDDQPGYPSP